MMKITISGLPGSGTTTLSKNLKKTLNFDYIYAGKIFREMADKRGLSVEEFNKQIENDPSIDTNLDRQVMSFADSHDNCIVEGRLSGWFAHREQSKDFVKIWVTAPIAVRLDRIAHRENEALDVTSKKVEMREKSEAKRYKEIYGIDISNLSIYDLIVDTSDKTPEETLDFVLSELEKHGLELPTEE
ncbi:MAG: AAA family ATPase [Patescibacteria group bacterium]|nr:AAA family ATPase [Patescibacteria group bacterium]